MVTQKKYFHSAAEKPTDGLEFLRPKELAADGDQLRGMQLARRAESLQLDLAKKKEVLAAAEKEQAARQDVPNPKKLITNKPRDSCRTKLRSC